MRRFKLHAAAGGYGSTLIDQDTGVAIDGITRIELVVAADMPTKITLTLLGHVDADIEAEQIEKRAWIDKPIDVASLR